MFPQREPNIRLYVSVGVSLELCTLSDNGILVPMQYNIFYIQSWGKQQTVKENSWCSTQTAKQKFDGSKLKMSTILCFGFVNPWGRIQRNEQEMGEQGRRLLYKWHKNGWTWPFFRSLVGFFIVVFFLKPFPLPVPRAVETYILTGNGQTTSEACMSDKRHGTINCQVWGIAVENSPTVLS